MDWGIIAGIAGTLAVVGGALMWFFKVAAPFMRKWSRRWDKIFGVPADPDTRQPAVPGVLERLDAQDGVLRDQNEVLQKVLAEVQDNHGGSMKDAVKRLERRFDEHLANMTQPPPQPQTQININPAEPPPAQDA